jgi:hypothetical protein
VIYLLKLRFLWLGVSHMAAIIPSEQLALTMTQRARALLDEFQLDQQECPEDAWESLADLRQVICELTHLFPARSFRRPHQRIGEGGAPQPNGIKSLGG